MKKSFKSIIIIFFLGISSVLSAQTDVTATVDTIARTATMSNGIVTVSINSSGLVSSFKYKGTEMLSNGGKFYLDYTDSLRDNAFKPNTVKLEKLTSDIAEVVFSHTTGQLILQQGFILRKGVSGMYTYVTVKGTSQTVRVREMRVVFRVDPNMFTYGYVTDRMQGQLPSVAVMAAVNSSPIMDATYQLPDGTIYTKYNWANYIVRDSVHGIMSNNIGLWDIPVSHEYYNGGPMKQELTVHTTNKTPLVLQMLQGEHFGTSAQEYRTGDEKIYGPFFVYVNSDSTYSGMIADAKKQVAVQKAQWPFQWMDNPLYPLQRTTVTGNINITPGLNKDSIRVVLAQPGGDVYDQGKQYIYWALTDKDGNYRIDHVRPGTYTLYMYAMSGEVTDENAVNNEVISGTSTVLDTVKWRPTKYQNLLWLIGENDRMSTGFHYSDTIRQYGLYNLPPANLNYVVGTSKPSIDWYYAQTKDGTWTVTFNNPQVQTGNAVLTASIAGAANSPSVNVYVNGVMRGTWSFSNDASIYRSAVLGGRHTVKTLTFPASVLKVGQNTVSFTMSNVGSRGGVIYDCIKLEAGGLYTGVDNVSTANHLETLVYPTPFYSQTTIEVDTPVEENISIHLFDMQGRKIKTLFHGEVPAGKQQFVWKPEHCEPGIYFYTVQSKSGLTTGKLVYEGQ